MTTRPTVEDFLDAVRKEPELRDMVRREILGDPSEEGIAKTVADVAKLTRANAEAIGRNAAAIEKNAVAIERLTTEVGKLTTEVRRNTDSTGDLKGLFMERDLREDAPVIASSMGLRWIRSLERVEIIAMMDNAVAKGLASNINKDDRESFHKADIVMEVSTPDDNMAYVAVEISFTGDERDTDRSVRNARYLTRFTKLPAYAAVASVKNVYEINDLLTTTEHKPISAKGEGLIFWYKAEEPRTS